MYFQHRREASRGAKESSWLWSLTIQGLTPMISQCCCQMPPQATGKIGALISQVVPSGWVHAEAVDLRSRRLQLALKKLTLRSQGMPSLLDARSRCHMNGSMN